MNIKTLIMVMGFILSLPHVHGAMGSQPTPYTTYEVYEVVPPEKYELRGFVNEPYAECKTCYAVYNYDNHKIGHLIYVDHASLRGFLLYDAAGKATHCAGWSREKKRWYTRSIIDLATVFSPEQSAPIDLFSRPDLIVEKED